MTLLKAENISVKIGESLILNQINLNITGNEIIGIIGPNGCGKTTFFNTISGFIPPATGDIYYNNCNISKLEPHQRAKLGIGRAFQNFGIFREMSLMENMICALEGKNGSIKSFFPWSKSHRKNKNIASEYLAQINLQDKLHMKAANLSGGQMRLLEIMRTLAAGADLFLLDEPTAGVSPKMKEDVAGIINKLRELNKTILIIEHDINFIQKFCQRIVVFDSGKILLDDSPENVRNNKQLQEIYFGS